MRQVRAATERVQRQIDRLLAPAVMLVVLLPAAACSGGTTSAIANAPQPQAIEDYDDLVSLMYNRNLDFVELGEVQIPCLSVNPKAVLVGGTVEIWEYEDIETATAAIGRINPTRFEAVLIDVEPYLHYYKGKKLVVRYLGDVPEVIAALESAFGPQFAGDYTGTTCYSP